MHRGERQLHARWLRPVVQQHCGWKGKVMLSSMSPAESSNWTPRATGPPTRTGRSTHSGTPRVSRHSRLGVTAALPVIGIVHTANSAGYRPIEADGGIFVFGEAGFVDSHPERTVHVTGCRKPHPQERTAQESPCTCAITVRDRATVYRGVCATTELGRSAISPPRFVCCGGALQGAQVEHSGVAVLRRVPEDSRHP